MEFEETIACTKGESHMPDGPIVPVLGIETSCDETAASVVDGSRAENLAEDQDGGGRILSNIVFSQVDEHRPYGGVVPEIAARAHVEHIDGIVAQAMQDAGLEFSDLAGIAATAGPGLIGGVMVGLVTAKALAAASGVPFIGVNHLEGHALSVRLNDDVPFPYLLLLVSGGHCQLLIVKGVGQYQRLGTTIDDAIGEAFDKTAKLLGLGYPGGPAVEEKALSGDPSRFALPRPLIGRDDCHFSFSGLKTAVRRAAEKVGAPEDPSAIADLCASFQAAIGDVLADRTKRAMALFRAHASGPPATLVVAGGVAANTYLRERLSALSLAEGFNFASPPTALCTDNGAMIAWAGLEKLRLGQTSSLDEPARARWPLDPAAPVAVGAGIKA